MSKLGAFPSRSGLGQFTMSPLGVRGDVGCPPTLDIEVSILSEPLICSGCIFVYTGTFSNYSNSSEFEVKQIQGTYTPTLTSSASTDEPECKRVYESVFFQNTLVNSNVGAGVDPTPYMYRMNRWFDDDTCSGSLASGKVYWSDLFVRVELESNRLTRVIIKIQQSFFYRSSDGFGPIFSPGVSFPVVNWLGDKALPYTITTDHTCLQNINNNPALQWPLKPGYKIKVESV